MNVRESIQNLIIYENIIEFQTEFKFDYPGQLKYIQIKLIFDLIFLKLFFIFFLSNSLIFLSNSSKVMYSIKFNIYLSLSTKKSINKNNLLFSMISIYLRE